MRRQKYYFDLKFEISAKLRFEWCITLYDSFWICLCFPANSLLRRREDITNLEKSSKFIMNHIKLYIIRSAILRWFRIWGQNNIFAYAFKRKSRFKKFAWANQKNLMYIESALKFQFEICAYVDTCVISNSRIAHVQKIEFS